MLIPGNIQRQVGWVSEQPDVAEDVRAHGRGVEVDGLLKVPSNPNYSMIL